MTVTGVLSTTICFPRIEGSELKLFLQNDQLTTATGNGWPTSSASEPTKRPMAGCSPRDSKNVPPTNPPNTVRGSIA